MAPISAKAQLVVEIDDEIACPSCLVEAGPSITLVVPEDSLWFVSLPGVSVARDSEGNYMAAPVQGDGLIAVFGPDGGYRSSFGRIGAGPGEFATDMLLLEIGDDDVLYAIDPVHLYTLAPLAEASLDRVRMPVRMMGEVVVLQSGIAVAATVRTEAGTTTIQLLRPDDGTILRSFGATGVASETGAEFGSRRVLGTSNDRMDVWSAPTNRFRLTRYGPDGEAKAHIERTSEFFRPISSFTHGSPFLAPANTAVTGIVQDGDGLLWIAIARPPRSFLPLAGQTGARVLGGEVTIPSNVDLNRFLHTTVEVLDPAAGTVIARRDFGEHVRFVRTRDNDVAVYSLQVDELGRLDCVVTPLALRRP